MAQATSRIFLAAPQENILTISYPIHWGRADMKALRASLMRMGFALVFFVAGLAGARAQALHLTVFSGTAQLPVAADWQGKTLPAGEYALYYGTRMGGTHYVEIAGKTQGAPHLFITPRAYRPSSSGQDELVCARDGNRLVVLELQMSGIGESLSFGMSRSSPRMGLRTAIETGRQVVAAARQIQRVPVTTERK